MDASSISIVNIFFSLFLIFVLFFFLVKMRPELWTPLALVCIHLFVSSEGRFLVKRELQESEAINPVLVVSGLKLLYIERQALIKFNAEQILESKSGCEVKVVCFVITIILAGVGWKFGARAKYFFVYAFGLESEQIVK